MLIALETEGLLARTDYLSTYIPDFPNGDKITIQHLIDNRSGLPREPNLSGVTKKELSQAEIMEWAKKEQLLFEPGTSKQYSNVGYEVLYHIIGELRGTTFARYSQETFFPKLDMINSGSRFATPNTNLPVFAKNHQYDEEIVQVPNVMEDDYRQSMLFATAEDLQKFLAHVSNEPFRTALMNDKGIIAWSGGGDGIRAHVQLNTADDYSFVFLASYDEIPFQRIVEDVAKIMEDQAVEMP